MSYLLQKFPVVFLLSILNDALNYLWLNDYLFKEMDHNFGSSERRISDCKFEIDEYKLLAYVPSSMSKGKSSIKENGQRYIVQWRNHSECTLTYIIYFQDIHQKKWPMYDLQGNISLKLVKKWKKRQCYWDIKLCIFPFMWLKLVKNVNIVCWILQKYCIFWESDKSASSEVKNPQLIFHNADKWNSVIK